MSRHLWKGGGVGAKQRPWRVFAHTVWNASTVAVDSHMLHAEGYLAEWVSVPRTYRDVYYTCVVRNPVAG